MIKGSSRVFHTRTVIPWRSQDTSGIEVLLNNTGQSVEIVLSDSISRSYFKSILLAETELQDFIINPGRAKNSNTNGTVIFPVRV